MGARQRGDVLLRPANVAEDCGLLLQARQAADILMERDPAATPAHLGRWLNTRLDFMKA